MTSRCGFDAFVGNPPFLGGKRISTVHGGRYREWLTTLHAQSNANSDIVAHFYRRTFGLLRPAATFGLVATNTIAQGDTRATGLAWICRNGGVIYDATKRYKWKGPAAVITSIVHVQRQPDRPVRAALDGVGAERISAFLFRGGSDEDPARLRENDDKAFVGSYVLGMGFTFDDDNEAATPLAEMRRLETTPATRERIFPYLGGDELNSSPTQAHRRYIIDFADMPQETARAWPELFAIVEAKVKPQRLAAAKEVAEYPWWQFWNQRRALYKAIDRLERVLVIARVSDSFALSFVPARQVFSEQLVVFAFDSPAAFAVLQSRAHEVWARFLASTMGDGLRYGPTDCFETFPFPPRWEESDALVEAGRAYHDARAAFMARSGAGLTATYARFHDPDERTDDVHALRELHAAIDRAVLDAYGWRDISPECAFEPIQDDDEEESARRSRKKKRWRYRWPEALRDEVLGQLLALNASRASSEAVRQAAAPPVKGPKKARPRKAAPGRRIA